MIEFLLEVVSEGVACPEKPPNPEQIGKYGFGSMQPVVVVCAKNSPPSDTICSPLVGWSACENPLLGQVCKPCSEKASGKCLAKQCKSSSALGKSANRAVFWEEMSCKLQCTVVQKQAWNEDHNNHGNCIHDDFDNDMILIYSITIYKHVSDQTERWLQLRFTGSNSLLLAGTHRFHSVESFHRQDDFHRQNVKSMFSAVCLTNTEMFTTQFPDSVASF